MVSSRNSRMSLQCQTDILENCVTSSMPPPCRLCPIGNSYIGGFNKLFCVQQHNWANDVLCVLCMIAFDIKVRNWEVVRRRTTQIFSFLGTQSTAGYPITAIYHHRFMCCFKVLYYSRTNRLLSNEPYTVTMHKMMVHLLVP